MSKNGIHGIRFYVQSGVDQHENDLATFILGRRNPSAFDPLVQGPHRSDPLQSHRDLQRRNRAEDLQREAL